MIDPTTAFAATQTAVWFFILSARNKGNGDEDNT
jgi:hypothetical protein